MFGKRINKVRKERGLTSAKLAESCHIDATYLRQIEAGIKTPSLPLFIDICNTLEISPDYLLRDELFPNEISRIQELTRLWEDAPPSQQATAAAMIRALFEHLHDND